MAALDALALLRDLREKAEEEPLRWWRWTPPQLALLRSTDPRVLLRTGNQIGKTSGGLAETIFRCTGRHPYKRVRPPPIEAWIITASWSQSLAIQQKLWAMLPKKEIVPDTVFDPARGFRGGATPVVEFKNGSIIRIKTGRQGALMLAGATIHFVLGDEPFQSQRIYSEVERRLTRTGGDLYMTMTPVNADVSWVQKKAEAGQLTDLHFAMTPDVFVPEGQTRPLRTEAGVPMTAEWIQEQREMVMAHEEPVVIDGEWEFRSVERIFTEFRPDQHVVPNLRSSPLMPDRQLTLSLGLDYGEDRLRTGAMLVGVDEHDGQETVFFLDEYVPETASTTEMDAEGILAMLHRNGLQWRDLDYAFGDKRYTDASGRHTKKSNARMMVALGEQLGIGQGLRPRIRSAKRGQGAGAGAVWRSVRYVHDAMIRPRAFFIDARCRHFIEATNKWDGRSKSEHKDILDGGFYALRPWAIWGRRRRSALVMR